MKQFFKQTNRKKILGILLSIALCLQGGTLRADMLQVQAAESVSDDSLWQYTVNEDGTGTITGYSGTYASEMNIPAEIDGVAMTAVGSGDSILFSYNTTIAKVTIPDGVTRISNYAFKYCEGMTEINIPEGVSSIGKEAFRWCSKLSALELPDSLTQMGDFALQDCTSLEELSIPAGVTNIGDGVISGCTSLSMLTVSSENTVYDSRDNCNAIIKTGTNTLKAGCSQTVIPDTVKKIGEYAFHYCQGLTEVVLPEGLTSIGEYAFYYCQGLTEVVLPEGLTSIGEYAFCYCQGLTEVTLPEGLSTLGNDIFGKCEKLAEVTLPSSLTSIGNRCFMGCAALQEITIPDRVAEIGSCAFYDCSALARVTLPRCLKSVYGQSFYGCTALEEITIPKRVSSINGQAFYGCTSLGQVNIHQGVTYIASDSFSNCTDALTFYTTEGAYAASYAEENDITVAYVEKDAWDDFANSGTGYVSADVSDTTGRIDEFKVGLYLEYNDTYTTSILNEQTISEDGDYTVSYKAAEAVTSMEAFHLVTNLRELSEYKQTSGFLTVTGVSVQYNGQISRFMTLDTAQNYWVSDKWSGYSVYGYDITGAAEEAQAASGSGLTLLPGDILQVHFTVSGMGTADSEPTLNPTPTPKPEPIADQDQAFLMFTDGSWSWGNWNTKVSGGFGNDVTITGNGDYAVSIDADGFAESQKDEEGFVLSAADGAAVFCVDFMNLCNSPNLDVSEMEVSNVKIYADNKTISVNDSKIKMGDIEGKGNYRMEIMNQYGFTVDDPAIDPDALTFKSSLKVAFTLSGIKEGTSEKAFACDSDGDGNNDTFYAVSGASDSWSAAGAEDPNPIYTVVLPSASPKAPATQKPGSVSLQPSASAAAANPSGTPKASASPGVTSVPGKTGTPAPTATVDKSSLKVSGVKVKITKKLKSGYLYVPQIKLTWKKNASTDGYEIWRKAPGAGTYTEVETLGPSGIISWTDTSVQRGKTYYYKVRPYQVSSDAEGDEIIEGVYSSEVKLTVKGSLKKPVITVTPAEKRVTLTFKRAEGSHYETRYRYLGDKKWKKLPVMTGKKIKKKIVRSLNATGFQMQVRTYCTVKGKKVYSKWSAAKTIR